MQSNITTITTFSDKNLTCVYIYNSYSGILRYLKSFHEYNCNYKYKTINFVAVPRDLYETMEWRFVIVIKFDNGGSRMDTRLNDPFYPTTNRKLQTQILSFK